MLKTGEKIDLAAKSSGINLHRLSEKADIPYNTLYSIVRRNSDKVDLDIIRRLSLALDVSPISILGDDVLEWIDFGMDIYKKSTEDSADFAELDNRFRLDNAIKKAYKIKGTYLIVDVESENSDFSDSMLYAVWMQLMELNDDGQQKVVDYAGDLVASGKYQRTQDESSDVPTEGETPPEGE